MNSSLNKVEKEYAGSSIQVLEGLEAVRKRPGMYIGSTDLPGLHHLVYEIIDNSIDESMAGYCNQIQVKMLPNNIIQVTDNGRGIPIDTHPKLGIPTVEVVLTKLHAGGKFGDGAYKVSGGLHGVGVSVVNALSEKLTVEVYRDGKCYSQDFERGKPKKPQISTNKNKSMQGTKVSFLADDTIFDSLEYRYDTLASRFRELAFLNKQVTIHIEDSRDPEKIKQDTFHYKGGIKEFVDLLAQKKTPIHKKHFYFTANQEEIQVELCMMYTSNFSEQIFTFVNSIHTREGGTHLEGFRTALTRALNEIKKNLKFDKKMPEALTGDDVREGLVMVISVLIPNPQFEGQTKMKLGNGEVKGVVQSLVYEHLVEFLEDNKNEAQKIIERCVQSASARIAAKKARDLVRRKTALDRTGLPGKLADCTARKPEDSELFIVEGDSAGGSAKQGRDRMTQAILPLKGKITNVEKTKLEKILGDNEVKALITALGCGIGNEFDVSKIRYHKIIIMTDADVDGAHIQTLLLTFFFRYMPALIEHGYLFIARPPLYLIRQGKKSSYAYTDKEKDTIVTSLNQNNQIHLQRYKGLGEMNPTQLWETTMDPIERVLMKVSVDDEVLADEVFIILMGDQVEPRRKFIEKHAQEVKDLDL